VYNTCKKKWSKNLSIAKNRGNKVKSCIRSVLGLEKITPKKLCFRTASKRVFGNSEWQNSRLFSPRREDRLGVILANMPPETIVLPGGKELEFCRFGIAEHPLTQENVYTYYSNGVIRHLTVMNQ